MPVCMPGNYRVVQQQRWVRVWFGRDTNKCRLPEHQTVAVRKRNLLRDGKIPEIRTQISSSAPYAVHSVISEIANTTLKSFSTRTSLPPRDDLPLTRTTSTPTTSLPRRSLRPSRSLRPPSSSLLPSRSLRPSRFASTDSRVPTRCARTRRRARCVFGIFDSGPTRCGRWAPALCPLPRTRRRERRRNLRRILSEDDWKCLKK